MSTPICCPYCETPIAVGEGWSRFQCGNCQRIVTIADASTVEDRIVARSASIPKRSDVLAEETRQRRGQRLRRADGAHPLVWVAVAVATATLLAAIITIVVVSNASRDAEAAQLPGNPLFAAAVPKVADAAAADELPAEAPLDGEHVYQRLLKSVVWVIARHDVNVPVAAGPAVPAGPDVVRFLGQWSGTENLAGFGNLRFHFVSPTAVFMHDAKETVLGNWSVNGANVTLRFFNGSVVYVGQLNGQKLSGSANNGKETWTWSVSRGVGVGPGFPRPPQLKLPRPGLPAPPDNVLVTSTGSGVLVDRKHRLFLTNVHVVGNTGSVSVYFPEFANDDLLAKREDYKAKPGITGKVVLLEERSDLALVQLESLPANVRAVPLAAKSARPAQPVHSVGNPGASGALWIYSPGRVRQVFQNRWRIFDDIVRREINYDAMILETDSPINPGDSGGPLVDDRGRLVGIAHGVHLTAKNLSIFIDVRECRGLLDRYYQSLEKRQGP